MPTKKQKPANVEAPKLSKAYQILIDKHTYIDEPVFKRTIGATAQFLDRFSLGKLLDSDNAAMRVQIYIDQEQMGTSKDPFTFTTYFLFIEGFQQLYWVESIYEMIDLLDAMRAWFKIEQYNEAIKAANDTEREAHEKINEGKDKLTDAEKLRVKIKAPVTS